MTTAVPDLTRPVRPLALAAIALCGVLASAFLGGTTNAVNGLVSPTYFVTIMRWENVGDVWAASVAQGVFEGLCFGVFFSLVFTAATGVITRGSCHFGFAFRHLLGILGATYICWAFGGLCAVGLAALSPGFYRSTFYGVPQNFNQMLGYAWVGGSIWGAELGALVSVVIGLVMLWTNWRRLLARQRALSDGRPAGFQVGGRSEQIVATQQKLKADVPFISPGTGPAAR